MAVDWVRLELALAGFDDGRFGRYLQNCRDNGIEFTTMAALGDTAEHRRALYDLNKTCSADIPDRGEFYTFAEYVAQRLVTPTYDPRGVVLALDCGTWIGMAATSLHADGHAFSEMTGVLASHRGRGVSLAMKVLAISFARSAGMRQMRASHHPGNVRAVAMNRRLGFVEEGSRGASG